MVGSPGLGLQYDRSLEPGPSEVDPLNDATNVASHYNLEVARDRPKNWARDRAMFHLCTNYVPLVCNSASLDMHVLVHEFHKFITQCDKLWGESSYHALTFISKVVIIACVQHVIGN